MKGFSINLLKTIGQRLSITFRRYPLTTITLIVISIIALSKIKENWNSSDKQRIQTILKEIDQLSKENRELEVSLLTNKWIFSNYPHNPVKQIPTTEYENLRRKIFHTVKEFWNLVRYHLQQCSTILYDNPNWFQKSLDRIFHVAVQHKRHLLNSINNLSLVDGYSQWRIQESNDLKMLIQSRLNYIQNPKNCTTAKKVLCRLQDFISGYGSTFHHVVSCLLIAYGLQRTLILDPRKWIYDSEGWNTFYQPVSTSCPSYRGREIEQWPGNNDVEVIYVPLITSLYPYPQYLPMAVPDDMIDRLERLHGNPSAWWIGQLADYLFNLNNDTMAFINNFKSNIGYKSPIVGVHIRRTDKISEAQLYNLKDYMDEVEEYYDQVSFDNTQKRRIYLASEDSSVIEEAKTHYPHYEILTNDKRFINLSRYSLESLKGVIIDVYFLSSADYLVCTFSSNVCRLAYELMQVKYPDASNRFKSLDSYFLYGGVREKITHVATETYNTNEEFHLDLKPGDKIFKYYNYWSGYSAGFNFRTKTRGIFPSFKDKVFSMSYNYSDYSDIDWEIEWDAYTQD